MLAEREFGKSEAVQTIDFTDDTYLAERVRIRLPGRGVLSLAEVEVMGSVVDPDQIGAPAGGRRSWTIRIGTGGNLYSHRAPDLHGESFPPQAHPGAPWVDEVQQTVSVNLRLNNRSPYNKPYFVHQAGVYQRDGPYTDAPFWGPSLARHCAGSSCSFASW